MLNSMVSVFKKVGLAVCMVMLVGCASSDKGNWVDCKPEQRPQPGKMMPCTAIYDPVCGEMDDGSTQTQASVCSACANTSVKRYTPGECK